MNPEKSGGAKGLASLVSPRITTSNGTMEWGEALLQLFVFFTNSIFKCTVALVTELEEPYEGRSSRTVLWEREGEIPRVTRLCLESMSSTNIECFTKDGRQLK